jgi:hypothetical protein
MENLTCVHIENLRNRLQTHSEEHGGNHKIQNLMWTHWEPDGNMTRNRHWELEEQVTNPFRRTLWNHKIQNLMWTHWEPDGNVTRNTHWELEEQVTNPFRRTLWEPQNSELDVNTLRTWWERDEEHTLRTWVTGYKPIQKNIVGTTKFRTWLEQIENLILMRAWWGTDIGNLRNRLQTH